MEILEGILVNILVRFPLKSIARFRLVSKEWKSLIDSDFFRDHYISLNSSSSISWSIIQTKPHKLSLEIVGHHGCRRWGLSASLGSLVSFFAETTIRKLLVLACTDGLVLIFAEASDWNRMYYIGNPLLQEWVVGKKGVRYSCLRAAVESRHDMSIALNGILHWLSRKNDTYEATSIVAYDFFGCHYEDECRIVRFPGQGDHEARFRRKFTTSQGYIVYFNEFGENENRTLQVWKLVKYTDGPESWQLSWELKLASSLESGINYFPVVMHPLNIEIIYLWSINFEVLILFNLRTLVYSVHDETKEDGQCMDGCILSFNGCKEYMGKMYQLSVRTPQDVRDYILCSQYVLRRWLHRFPRPQSN